MKRRTFMKTAAGASAAAGAGVFGILKYPRGAKASVWGQWPEDREDLMIPAELRPTKVLELCFHGGITPWETFYANETWGQGNNTYTNLFDDEPFLSPRNFYNDVCQYADYPGQNFTDFFANDTAGQEVFLGPWVWPLKLRPDITSRMRVLVQYHTVLAHEGANPVSFTGDFVGNPRMAGIGAPIQRYFSELEGGRAVPYSFVLYPGGAGFSGFNVGSASAIGFHPGSARPLNVTVSQDSVLAELLSRPGLDGSDPEAFDAAVSHYVQAYENRFRQGGVGSMTRSLERDNYGFANFARQNANELVDILPPSLFAEIQGQVCEAGGAQGVLTQGLDMPAMMANVARSLLTRETNQARYVNWIDTGLFPRPEIGFDVHNEHVLYTARSVPHTLQALADIIQDPNEPRDPSLISLDDTLIVLNMEFGRTPYRQVPGSSGTNHWPYGYVNVLIGGPVTSPSVYGDIIPPGQQNEGYANPLSFVTPAENRIMVLSAMGIYPFSSQSYAVADVRFADDEIECATRVRDELWGIKA